MSRQGWDIECAVNDLRLKQDSISIRNQARAGSRQPPGSRNTSEVSSPKPSHSRASSRGHHTSPQSNDISEDEANVETQAQGRLLKDETGHPFYIGPSPIATFLTQASSNISKVMNDVRDTRLHMNATDSLADLSSTFAAVGFHDPSEARKKVRSFKRANEPFFIPEKEEGIHLIKLFTETMAKGSPFFSSPPEGLVPKIAFEPSAVKERGWLLLFNALVSTDLALREPPDLRLSRCLQWNIWMLIEDSSIFLEPSVVSIQALCLLASHGQEITTSSLCWTLMTHACQMVQTLALHLPIPRTPPNSDVNRHRNCLFWGLFIVDKALALSVGRPPLLPAYLYKNVPLPDPQALALYRPHRQINGAVLPEKDPTLLNFGGFYIMRNLELAKLQGEVSDLMYGQGRNNTLKIGELKQELDKWMYGLIKSPYFEIKSRTTPEEQEVQLGVNIQNFQYHHLVVYLTRGDKNNEQVCLESARAAISLLEQLVSSSRQVFNGIIWQLLYQPFTPYFVLFSNIVSHPTSPTCFKDIQYLHQVVLYFLQMNKNHPSAAKLEKIADTFTRLAEAYVRHTTRRNQNQAHATEHPPPLPSYTQAGPSHSNHLGVAQPTSEASPSLPGLETPSYASSNPSSDFSSLPPLPPLDLNTGIEFNFNDMPTDPLALLNFFTPASDPMNFQGQGGEGLDIGDEEALLRELKSFEQSGTLDGTFDWFSWDAYDGSMC
ncbi:uncharacterized protein PAC_14370 [Phialocephala subalpina]|uniref:Xylanolytic transcriptional activator regulatory domain-containing protein n=1 Tax=Phialocephala subalpina TaxID=576137 RepID=A0A1L7XHG4_9HELO|nr:uncharacterized protein PAC_14370 [Phialocephala subalpina]